MACSNEEITLLNESENEESDDESLLLQRQVESERRAKRDAMLQQNELHLDVPLLPRGKTHHLFVSHSNEEEEAEWAENLVKDLERQYGLKCMWPKRDFKAGRDIGSEIKAGITASMKVVVILSPDSINSGWCKYERDLAFNISAESQRNIIIPVLYRPCEVPNTFETLNYIDVTRGEDYTFRIRRCFDEDMQDMECLIPGFKPKNNTQEAQNGRRVSIQGVKNLKYICRGPAWSFRDLDIHQRYELRKLGSRYAEKVFFEARNLCNSSWFMKYYSVVNVCRHSCPVCVILVIILLILITLLYYVVDVVKKETIVMSKSVAVLYLLGTPVLVLAVMFAVDYLNHRSLQKKLMNYSLQSFWQTKVLVNISGGCSNPPRMVFVYYDASPCLNHLSNFVAGTQNIPGDGFGEEAENLARQIAKDQLLCVMRENYRCLFIDKGLPQTAVNRHPTYNNRKCICEIAQEKLWKTQNV